MEEKSRLKMISSIDIIVTIFIIIIGFFVILLGTDWLEFIDLMKTQSNGTGIIDLLNQTPWIIIFIGITTLLYGVKRIIDDLIKLS
jgi:uncharacterized membrane protein